MRLKVGLGSLMEGVPVLLELEPVEENAVAKEKLVKRSIRGKQKRSVKRTEKRELRGEDN